MVTRKTLALAALAAAGVLTLAGCGGDDSMEGMSGMGTSSSAPTSSSEPSADFNEADVTFATDMIPHHRQAVEMAELAASRADNPEVKQLARQISDAQDPEIQTMSDWLASWGQPVPEDMSGMDMSGSMPGMMSGEEMSKLESAEGAEFDQMFLTMMIAHHQGAIEMAKTESADGQNEDAVALAQKIQKDQAAEIKTMQGLLR